MRLKFLMACFASIFAVSMMAQSAGEREKLEAEVQEISRVLPISLQQGIVYKQKYILDNSVYEVNEIDEKYVSLASLRQKRSTMKKTLLKQYGSNPNLISFAELVVQCGMDIVVCYVSKQSGNSFSITLSKKELAKCIN